MRFRVVLALAVASTATTASAAPPIAAPPTAPPIDGPPFTASPADLLALAARPAPADRDVEIVREDIAFSLDAGKVTSSYHLVFVVRTQDGASQWSRVSASYRASNQARPVIRARAIDPSGHEVAIDGSGAVDEPVVAGPQGDASDRHRVTAPALPLAVGSVVEEELVFTDTSPRLASGAVERFYGGSLGPMQAARVSISVPSSVQPTLLARALPAGVRPVRQTANGRTTWTYTLADVASARPEPDEPVDVVDTPEIGFSTAPSWNAVARELAAVVDRQLAAGPAPWPAGVAKAPTLATARAIVAWVRGQVRDLGIEVDDASLVPVPPAQTASRGRGDGLSIATLVVQLLRDAGIRADVALIYAGNDLDVDPALPGIYGFDRVAQIRPGRDSAVRVGVEHRRERGRAAARVELVGLLERLDRTGAVDVEAVQVAERIAEQRVAEDDPRRGPRRLELRRELGLAARRIARAELVEIKRQVLVEARDLRMRRDQPP